MGERGVAVDHSTTYRMVARAFGLGAAVLAEMVQLISARPRARGRLMSPLIQLGALGAARRRITTEPFGCPYPNWMCGHWARKKMPAISRPTATMPRRRTKGEIRRAMRAPA